MVQNFLATVTLHRNLTAYRNTHTRANYAQVKMETRESERKQGREGKGEGGERCKKVEERGGERGRKVICHE